MRAVLQRVRQARVRVDGEVVAQIGAGVVALVAATHTDGDDDVATMARKIADLRVLADDSSLSDHIRSDGSASGSGDQPAALVVSQFTLYGVSAKGRRPSWSAAAPAHLAAPLVDAVVTALARRGVPVVTGVFGAQMEVDLVNDGPFTVIVDT